MSIHHDQDDGFERFWRMAIAGVLLLIALLLFVVSLALGAIVGIPAAMVLFIGVSVARAKGPSERIATKAVGLLVIAFFAYVATIGNTLSFSH